MEQQSEGSFTYFCTLPFGAFFFLTNWKRDLFSVIIQNYGAKGGVLFLISFLTLYQEGGNVGLVSNAVILHRVWMDS